jgi:hypothetical protein
MERLRFLHIPKTAGATFTSILKRLYFGKKKFDFTGDVAVDIKRFQALAESDRKKVVLFTGHAPIFSGLAEADNIKIITFLRNPLSRVKSFCQHVAEGKSPYLRKNFPPDSFNLAHFLRSGNLELSNLQTKMLINSSDCDSPTRIEKMSAAAARDAALENLFAKIYLFGLQEFFDESVLLFATLLHWRWPFYNAKKIRKIAEAIAWQPRDLELIAELNAIDMAVYQAAREKFLSVLSDKGIGQAKLKRFRLLNKLASPLMKACERRR